MPDTAHKIYDETNPTGTTYSDKISLKMGSLFSLHITNGGLTGTLTLWASNKPDPDLTDDTDWVENTDVSFDALAGASKQMINAGNAAARWYRVKYVHTSGSATLDIWANFGDA